MCVAEYVSNFNKEWYDLLDALIRTPIVVIEFSFIIIIENEMQCRE